MEEERGSGLFHDLTRMTSSLDPELELPPLTDCSIHFSWSQVRFVRVDLEQLPYDRSGLALVSELLCCVGEQSAPGVRPLPGRNLGAPLDP